MRTIQAATTTVSVFLAVLLAAPLALAQEQPAKDDTSKEQKKPTTKRDKKKANQTPPEKRDLEEGGAKVDQPPAISSDEKGGTDSDKPKKQPESTTVLGEKAVNRDEDLDMAVGEAATTSAVRPGTQDVIESRPEARREGEGRRVTVAPLFGYGTSDLGIGAGVRGGYTFDYPIYVGGTFMYHGGSDGTVDRPNLSSSSTKFYYPGVEVGYDVGIGPVLLRPYLGSGILFGRLATTDTNGVNATNTESAIMFYPGVTAHYVIRRSPLFVGGDARLLLPLENQAASLSLYATTGLYL